MTSFDQIVIFYQIVSNYIKCLSKYTYFGQIFSFRETFKFSRKIKLFNGSLECRFMKYEMYKGTKKIHKLVDKNQ